MEGLDVCRRKQTTRPCLKGAAWHAPAVRVLEFSTCPDLNGDFFAEAVCDFSRPAREYDYEVAIFIPSIAHFGMWQYEWQLFHDWPQAELIAMTRSEQRRFLVQVLAVSSAGSVLKQE